MPVPEERQRAVEGELQPATVQLRGMAVVVVSPLKL